MAIDDGIYGAFSKHTLFSVLPETILVRFCTTVSTQRVEKGQYLFIQGESADCAYVILKGQILLESISIDGERLSFARLTQGSLFGEFALFDDSGRSASAVAITPVTLMRIPKTSFLKLIPEHPDFSMRLIQHLVGLMRDADAQMESMQFRTLLQKVANYLARDYMQSRPENNELQLTQTDIARAISASREKVNKALQVLKNRKIILTGRGRITILNIEFLQDIYMDE